MKLFTDLEIEERSRIIFSRNRSLSSYDTATEKIKETYREAAIKSLVGEFDGRKASNKAINSFNFLQIGDSVFASGDGWEYTSFGNKVHFEQKGKVPSLRVIKSLIKKLKRC